MMSLEFEWDEEKAAANWAAPGLAFEQAAGAFRTLSVSRESMSAMSKTTTIARMRSGGTLVKVARDGRESVLPVRPARAMSAAEVHAAAMADADARPLTPEQLQRARRVPRVKTLRRALGLTQEEFAGRYSIPLGTLRDWEQGRSEPDQPARAYLHVIAKDPARVYQMLNTR